MLALLLLWSFVAVVVFYTMVLGWLVGWLAGTHYQQQLRVDGVVVGEQQQQQQQQRRKIL